MGSRNGRTGKRGQCRNGHVRDESGTHYLRPWCLYAAGKDIAANEKEAQTALTIQVLGEQDGPLQLETFGPFDQPIGKLRRDRPRRQIVHHLIEGRNGTCIRIGP